MAKAKKVSTEERLEKSLTSAAKILNKKMHLPDGAELAVAGDRTAREADLVAAVTLHQVFCPDEDKVIGKPTTDFAAAKTLRDNHNAQTGHLSTIISSN